MSSRPGRPEPWESNCELRSFCHLMLCMTQQEWLIQNNDASMRGRRTRLFRLRRIYYRSLQDAADINICIAAIAQIALSARLCATSAQWRHKPSRRTAEKLLRVSPV